MGTWNKKSKELALHLAETECLDKIDEMEEVCISWEQEANASDVSFAWPELAQERTASAKKQGRSCDSDNSKPPVKKTSTKSL